MVRPGIPVNSWRPSVHRCRRIRRRTQTVRVDLDYGPATPYAARMLVGTLVVLAIAVVVVVVLLRRGSMDPDEWSKRQPPDDSTISDDTPGQPESKAEVKSDTPPPAQQ